MSDAAETRQRWSCCGCSGADWRTGCGCHGGTGPVQPSCGQSPSRARSARGTFPQVPILPILIAAVAVAFLMQWGLTRATGIKRAASGTSAIAPRAVPYGSRWSW